MTAPDNARRPDWTFWAAIAVGAALRCVGLGAQSFWADEIASLLAGKVPLLQMVGWYRVDPHPPLFYTLVKIWLHFGETEGALRSVSALAGTGTVALTWLLGRRLAGREVAAFGALLVAINPLAVWTSQELRSLAVLALLATASVHLMVRYLEEGGRANRWAYIVTTVAACYAHYFAFFVVACEVGWLAVRARSAHDGPRRALTAPIWIALGYVPWLPFFLSQFHSHGQSFRITQGVARTLKLIYFYFTTSASPWKIETFFAPLDAWYYADARRFNLMAGLLLAPFVLAAAAGTVATVRRKGAAVLAPAFVIAQIALVVLVTRALPIFEPKYMIAAVPLTCLTIAMGLAEIRKRRPVVAYAAGAWIAVLTGVALVHGHTDPDYQRPAWRQAIAQMEERIAPEDAVFVFRRETVPDFIHYYGGPAPVFELLPGDNPIATVDGPEVIERALAEAGLRRTVWFVEGLQYLHDPQQFTLPTLRSHLWETDTIRVSRPAGYRLHRFDLPVGVIDPYGVEDAP